MLNRYAITEAEVDRMIETYPIMFDSTELPSPSQWDETSEVIENVNVTEAGTDQVEVTRYDKLTVNVKYRIAEDSTGGIANTLKEFSKKSSFTLKRYDVLAKTYEERTVRMRDFKMSLVPKSEYLTAVNGVWDITFTLKEF